MYSLDLLGTGNDLDSSIEDEPENVANEKLSSKRDIDDKPTELEPLPKKMKCESGSDNEVLDEESLIKAEDKPSTSAKPDGLPCLLKCKIQIKFSNNNIYLEILFTGGTMGKEGANQLMTYIKNKMKEGQAELSN